MAILKTQPIPKEEHDKVLNQPSMKKTVKRSNKEIGTEIIAESESSTENPEKRIRENACGRNTLEIT